MIATETFNFKIKAEPSGSFSSRTNTSALGDGYSVSSPDGINNSIETWSISVVSPLTNCDGTLGEAVAAYNFLKKQSDKAESFNWTNPLGDMIRVQCSTITPKKSGATFSVSTTFTRVYR